MLNKLKKLIGSTAPERQQPEETKQAENVKYAEELEASLRKLEAGVHESDDSASKIVNSKNFIMCRLSLSG